MRGPNHDLVAVLDAYVPASDREAADVERIRGALRENDVFSRASPLHMTASALVVHPPTQRVLLRWHPKLRQWMQVGGHFDPGETNPWAAALREAGEETGLTDLAPTTRDHPAPLQIVIVSVPPFGPEAAHEHADVRYLLTTQQPDAVQPESSAARLRWLPIAAAAAEVDEPNLRVFLARARAAIESGRE